MDDVKKDSELITSFSDLEKQNKLSGKQQSSVAQMKTSGNKINTIENDQNLPNVNSGKQPSQLETPVVAVENKPSENNTSTSQPNTFSADSSQSGGSRSQGKPAGIRVRLSAIFFDSMIVSIPINMMGVVAMLVTGNIFIIGNYSFGVLLSVVSALTMISYFVYFEVYFGATPGKKIYGLKVINIDTKNNLNTIKAIIREFFARGIVVIPILGQFFVLINFFVVVFSSTKRGIHDKFAKSQVVVINKSWSFVKQLGLFILLMILSSLPLALIFPKLIGNVEGLNSCMLECAQSKNIETMDQFELQETMQVCTQLCTR